MTYVIGLTGGIGSGKSAVSDCFASLGIDIVDADVAARTVVAPGSDALKEIQAHFGDEVILPDLSLNRAKLRQIIFEHPDERHWLESLTHPLIRQEIIDGLTSSRSPYTLLVSPLLLESKQHLMTQRILVVDVSETLQIERTVKRDSNSEKQVKAIIAAQISRKERLAKADDIIVNDSSLLLLREKVNRLHEKYLQLAKRADSES